MKWLNSIILGLILSLAVPVASADSLQLVSGSTTVTVPGTGTTSYSNSNFNGWNIFISFGSSNSPGLSPYGLDLNALVTCNGAAACATKPLDIFYSDTGFTGSVPAGKFQTTYSATTTGSGATSEIAWANASNSLFATGAGNKIGETGPFNAAGGFGTATGGPGISGPYSLTIEEIFTDTSGVVSFSTDANVTKTPEPGSMVMLGTGLLGLGLCGLFRRRKVRT